MFTVRIFLMGLSFDPIEHVKDIELDSLEDVKFELRKLQRAYCNDGEPVRVKKGPVLGTFIAYSDSDYSYVAYTKKVDYTPKQ